MGSLGKVKVDDVIRIPSAVKRFFDLKEGDYLEFWPIMEVHRIDEPMKATDCIVVKIIRKGKKK